MLDTIETRFPHIQPADMPWRSDGLRGFLLCRDLGVEAATAARVIAQRVMANQAPEKGTGRHRHEADFPIVEAVGPAVFSTVDAEGPCPVPAPIGW